MSLYDPADDDILGSEEDDLVMGGRYQIWLPGATKKKAFTRATTWADTLDDPRLLIVHYGRQVALALAARPDYLELVQSTAPDDKMALNKLCEMAVESVGGNSRANRGTAAHGFLARVLVGDPLVIVPDSMRADIDAMLACLDAHRLTVLPEYIEVVLVCNEIGVAGRCDLICVNEDGERVIVDFKTGDGLEEYAALKTSIQLAIYAHATTIYDPATRTHDDMPPVRQDVAYALSRPLGSDRCVLIEVDIVAGWKYAFKVVPLVKAARNHGQRKKDSMLRVLTTPLRAVPDPVEMIVDTFAGEVVEAPVEPVVWPVERPITPAELLPTEPLRAWILGRLEALKKEQHGSAAQALASRWPKQIPGFKGDHVHTDDELRALAMVLDVVEADFGVAFGDTDPGTTVKFLGRTETFVKALNPDPPPPREGGLDEGRTIEQQDIAAIVKRFAGVPPEVMAVINGWVAEAAAQDVSFAIKVKPTLRRFEIYRALLALLPLIDADLDMVRATIGSVVPGFGRRDQPIGVALGTLSIDEAVRLVDTATAVRRDPPSLAYDADGLVHWATPPIPE